MNSVVNILKQTDKTVSDKSKIKKSLNNLIRIKIKSLYNIYIIVETIQIKRLLKTF